ncbi:MAG: hypothetical protein C5B51_08965 [Terriglobia bacterium]|nr:MAG: hypothetical protein C5B51_08965 [Terriglobia bacterium]
MLVGETFVGEGTTVSNIFAGARSQSIKLFLVKITAALVAYGPWGLLLIGLIDSIGVPLPATIDALLILIAAKAPGQAYYAASLAVLGSLAGNLALFQTARYSGQRAGRDSEPDKPSKLSAWLRRYGLITVFVPAATPILPLPLKVFVVSAGALRTPLSKFLVVILAGRILRYFGEAFLGARLGAGAQGFLQHNKWTLLTIPIAVAALSYLVIQWIGRRSLPSPTESVESVSS